MKISMIDRLALAALALLFALSGEALAQRAEPRLALVIGNADYRAGPLPTAANDAGLVADTLRAEGFEVSGAANLDLESLRRAFRDFLGRASQAGPDAIVFVYLSGRGLQYDGENYFAPVEAAIARDTDAPIEALRLSDFTRALAALPLRARIIVFDMARANPFVKQGQPLAGGLALIDPEPGSLYAFNAAPGAIAPDEPGPYGAYASALAEILREGGLPIDEAFARIRLRVDQVTHGAFAPWDASRIEPPLALLPPDPKAPPPAGAQSYAALRARPIGQFPVDEAYAAAVERDTIDGYQDFLAAYPDARLARRVRALLAARREALTWRRAVLANTPGAYWTYMRRYPHGPHFWDARRRLIILSAPVEPPPRFDIYDFGGLPPPPPVEYEIVDRPVLFFDPDDYPPPPPPPVYFLPPRPVAFIELAPPPPPQAPGFLPIPVPIPIPFARPGAPQGVVIQQNFGQQGPVAPPPAGPNGAGAPGGGQQGAPGQTPPSGRPASPASTPPAAQPATPGQQAPTPGAAQPNHALPQGKELPQVGTQRATPPAAGAPAPTLAPQGAKPVAPQAAPVQEVAPGANHALPQGKELPPVGTQKATPPAAGAPAPTLAPQGAKPVAPQAAPVQEVAPGASHALPQGKELPPAGIQKATPPGAPAPTLAPQGAKPVAPHAPQVAPVQEPTAPVAPHPSELKTPPNHALPQGQPSTLEKAAPKAPPAKPKPPEPEAVPATPPAPQTKAPAPPQARIAPPEVKTPAPHPPEIKAAPPKAPPQEAKAPPPAKHQPPPKKEPGKEHGEEQR